MAASVQTALLEIPGSAELEEAAPIVPGARQPTPTEPNHWAVMREQGHFCSIGKGAEGALKSLALTRVKW